MVQGIGAVFCEGKKRETRPRGKPGSFARTTDDVLRSVLGALTCSIADFCRLREQIEAVTGVQGMGGEGAGGERARFLCRMTRTNTS